MDPAFEWLGHYKVPTTGVSLAHTLLQLLSSLRQRDARNGGAAAVATATFFKTVLSSVSASKSLTVETVLEHVASIEKRLASAAGLEFIAPNVARRVSRFIQEEATKRAAAAAAAEAAADGSVAAPGSGTMTLPSGVAAGGSGSGLDRADTDGTGHASIATAGPSTAPAAGGAAADGGAGAAAASGSSGSGPGAGSRSVADAKVSCAAALAAWAAAGSGSASAGAGASAAGSSAAAPASVLSGSGSGSGFGSMLFSSIRGGVLDAVNELLDELDTSSVTLAGAAGDVLGHGDVIMTAGYDSGVRDFLLAAMKARRVGEVIIAEGADAGLLPPPSTGATVGAPVLPGHALALELTGRAKPVPVTLIPDAAVAAVMHRVHKVVIGCRGVTVDGAVAADSPAGLLALAAAPLRVPVIVVANALRVIPSSRIADEAALADAVDAAGVGDPHAVLPRAAALAADALYEAAVLGHADPAGDASTSSASAAPGVEVVAYAFDVLPASSVALLVTNTGAAAPKQVRRLHDELYG